MSDYHKEKPFNIQSWEDLRRELATMQPRSKLYEIVRAEVTKRGNWRKRSPHNKQDVDKDQSV